MNDDFFTFSATFALTSFLSVVFIKLEHHACRSLHVQRFLSFFYDVSKCFLHLSENFVNCVSAFRVNF